MTSDVPHRPPAGHDLHPSISIRLIDRFGAERAAVAGWNPETTGFEATVEMFDVHPDGGPRPPTGALHDCWTVGSPLTSTAPPVMAFGRGHTGRTASQDVGGFNAGPRPRPHCRSLCLTVDSLIDALRFEGYRCDAADTERLSDLAEEAQRCNGPTILRGRTFTTGAGPRTRIRLEHATLPSGPIVFDGPCHDRADLLEAARCIIELCWSRCWTAVERDLTLALTLDVLTEVRHEFCLASSDIALWCLVGHPVPNRAGAPAGTGLPPAPGQLRLAL